MAVNVPHDWNLTDKTSPSGKCIFRCDNCKWELTAPTNGPCGTCEDCNLPLGCIGHALNCEGWTLPSMEPPL